MGTNGDEPVGYHRELLDLLRLLREEHGGDSLRAIHRRSGVSLGHLSKIFAGSQLPSRAKAIDIARALGASERQQQKVGEYADNAKNDPRIKRDWVADGTVNAVLATVQDYLATQRPPDRDEHPWRPFQPPQPLTTTALRELPPSELLATRHGVVSFAGRGDELACLRAWRDGTAPYAAHLVWAQGGEGKTRLADHFAQLSVTDGWTVLQADPAAGPPPARRWAASPGDYLLLVDYAERLTHDQLDRLLQWRPDAPGRIRWLLLARTDGPWWESIQYTLRVAGVAASQEHLAALADGGSQRHAVFRAAVRSFAPIYDVADPDAVAAPQHLEHGTSGSALTLHMAALAAVDAHVRGAAAPDDPGELSAYLLDREFHHWQRLSDTRRIGVEPSMMGRLTAVAVMAQPLPPPDAVRLLQTVELAASPPEAHAMAIAHAACYPPEAPGTLLEPMRPDRLGEDFLARHLPVVTPDGTAARHSHRADAWHGTVARRLLGTAADSADVDPGSRRNAWSVVIETGRRWPHVADGYLTSVIIEQPAVVRHISAASLTVLAGYAPLALLEVLKAQLPSHRNVSLDLPAAVIAARLAEHRMKTVATRQDEGALQLDLSVRLANAGLFEDAVTAAELAVAAYEALDEREPFAFHPALAAAWNQLGIVLGHVGRPGAAMAATRRASGIQDALATVDSRFSAGHGVILNNLAVDYNTHGRHADAHTAATKAVGLIRAAIEAGDGDPHLREQLAMALNNQGLSRLALGDVAASVEALQAAVEITAALAGEDPGRFEPDHARHLADLSRGLERDGQYAAALDHSAAAATILRRLVRHNPRLFADQLLKTLTKQAELAARTGATETPLALLQERTTLRRSLADRTDTAGDIVDEHRVTGLLHMTLGQWTQAVDALHRAVQEANRLSDGNAERFRPTLAEVLVDLNIALWRARRGPEAIKVGTAALDLYRTLRAEHPGVFDARLAAVLVNLATDLEPAGRPAESASLAEEAIAILRGLGSSAETSEALALALTNAALGRFSAGESEAALPLAEEALAILTRLDTGVTVPSLALLGASSCHAIVLATLRRAGEAADAARATMAVVRRLDLDYVTGDEGKVTTALQWCLRAFAVADDTTGGLAAADEMVRVARRFAGRSTSLAELLPLALLHRARLLDSCERADEAREADQQAIWAFEACRVNAGAESGDVSITAPAWRASRRMQAELFNDRGYAACRDERPEAVDLLRCADAIHQELDDPSGHAMALENLYFALRASRQYEAAFETLPKIVVRHLDAEQYDQVRQYVVEVIKAHNALEEVQSPWIVRDAHRDADLRRLISEHGESAVTTTGVLLVSPEQDILEVLGHVPQESRVRFAEAMARLAGIDLAAVRTGADPEAGA
ncbi:helix-turn-helix transcriptional regulator [Streptomyces sp. A2-16]|uniref:helix-turn-helix domain-containing protein n=1 Tax=Streptomyces sp. A2-16 TaxID=2781734 RepID=UPI001BAF8ADD|nr:helix-turn-helix transcriptional regulator [Streptomyces sp. A2-16]QUC59153.1 helix-turn-helix transcriptional regulator [Streptomyces sp. A2-16]